MHKDHPRETMATANIKPHSVDGVDLEYWAELIREHGSATASCSIAAATNRASKDSRAVELTEDIRQSLFAKNSHSKMATIDA